MQKCINTAQTYIRSRFTYNISMESEVLSHCVKHSLSEDEAVDVKGKPKDPYGHYSEPCTLEHSAHSCPQCDNLYHIFNALESALLRTHKRGLSVDDYEEMDYDLSQAKLKITHYIKHLMRAFAQNYDWDNMVANGGTDTVFIVQGI